MPDLYSSTQWIEDHQATVDLLKWLALLVIAWAAGLFRYLQDLTRTPRLAVSEVVSRCLIVETPYGGHADAQRCVYLLNIEVANRSSERIVVSAFEIRHKWRRVLPMWSPRSSAVSLPNRVHHQMGGGIKLMRNWFAYFPDSLENLTVDGKIDARDAASGFALFVSHTYGSWNPKIENQHVHVCVYARLTTGKAVKTSAKILVTRNEEFFEEMIPGITAHVEHPSSWNVPARLRSASGLGPVYVIPAFTRKKEEKQLPNTPTSSDAKLPPSLSLRPHFGAGCG